MNKSILLTITVMSCWAMGLPTTTGDHWYPGTFVQRAPSLADPAKQVDGQKAWILLAHKRSRYFDKCRDVTAGSFTERECHLLEMELWTLTQLCYSRPEIVAQELKKAQSE